MILTIDKGNSRSKFAVFEDDSIVCTETASSFLDLKSKGMPFKEKISKVIVSSVKDKGQDTSLLQSLQHFFQKAEVMEFNRSFVLPFINDYEDKTTVGLDRLAGISGASTLFGSNVLLIDAGTCITFDYLDANNIYQGGSISLGFQTKYKALHNFTANLPLVKSIELTDVCAKTTQKCIQAGVVNGTIFEIDKTIEMYKQRSKDLRVVLTGGDAKFIHRALDYETFVCENIVFYGLKKILELNAEKN